MVTGVDFGVGEILRVLKETGTLDDTLIVFCSDHGDACGDHGKVAKDTTYLESIMHLPLILHWPAGLGTTARRVGGLFEMVDLLPTLADLCGIDRHPLFQGRSIGNELLGGMPIEGRQDVYAYHEQGNAADLMLRTEKHKFLAYVRGGERRELLFDLRDDPDEMVDRAAEPSYAAVVRESRDRLFERHAPRVLERTLFRETLDNSCNSS
jgi:arylsulfatase A-like enzyme